MLKRLVDIILSFFLFAIAIPVIVLVSLTILMRIGRPILFIQKRPGRNGKPFSMIKFRTLLNTIDNNGNLLPESQRITKLGSFLRKTSLDELPELWNVLKGDMSLVGPRPLRMYYLPLYNDFQKRRHDVRPGITGWAQINGRNALGWEEKFILDVWYVENQSLMLDFKILILTLFKVLKRENTTASDGGFTKPFCGTGDKMVSLEEVQLLKRKLG
jgi:lipopolysaccharide/colanic/teichoic acid biosynthesis glycosyltransferase